MSNLRLVLWSGGCDSTLMLYDALTSQKTWIIAPDKNDPKRVDTRTEVRQISIVEPTVPCNAPQARARRRLLTEFKRRGIPFRPTIEVITSREHDQPKRHENGGSIQTQMWVGTATPYLCDSEDLLVGWHDGEFDNVEHVTSAFDALQRINGGKTGKLQFPLQRVMYATVIARLQALDLLDLCWWCEGGKHPAPAASEPCGTCNKCIAHATALWQLRKYGAKRMAEF